MIRISELSIYPVKSCGGQSLKAAHTDQFGLTGDRRWLITDPQGQQLTQRDTAVMALLHAEKQGDMLDLSFKGNSLRVATPGENAMTRQVSVWSSTMTVRDGGDEAAAWLSDCLQQELRLNWMQDDCRRPVDPEYASDGQSLSFADGFPILLVSQASLDDLNSRMSAPVPMNRFRPNVVVEGCEAFAEDAWKRLRIGELELEIVKPCDRCVMPSIIQETAERDVEINRVLATFRRGEDRKIYFGQNVLSRNLGPIAVGDELELLA